jgi:hypothetical protein
MKSFKELISKLFDQILTSALQTFNLMKIIFITHLVELKVLVMKQFQTLLKKEEKMVILNLLMIF